MSNRSPPVSTFRQGSPSTRPTCIGWRRARASRAVASTGSNVSFRRSSRSLRDTDLQLDRPGDGEVSELTLQVERTFDVDRELTRGLANFGRLAARRLRHFGDRVEDERALALTACGADV